MPESAYTPAAEKAQPKDLDPTMLSGGFTTAAGVTAWNVGEDGDVLLLGHHDDDAAWAAYVAFQMWFVGEEPHDAAPEVYDISRRYAAFSDHSEGCELVECHCDEDACEGCRVGKHDECADDLCECSSGYDHEFDGPWPCSCECYCDEYAWWVSTTKGGGHAVTWVSFSYEKVKALRDVSTPPGMTGSDDA